MTATDTPRAALVAHLTEAIAAAEADGNRLLAAELREVAATHGLQIGTPTLPALRAKPVGEAAGPPASLLPLSLLAVQALVICWLLYHYGTGGYSTGQLYPTAALLLIGTVPPLIVGARRVQPARLWPLALYLPLALTLLAIKPIGLISFGLMLLLLALSECGLLAYIWRIRPLARVSTQRSTASSH